MEGEAEGKGALGRVGGQHDSSVLENGSVNYLPAKA